MILAYAVCQHVLVAIAHKPLSNFQDGIQGDEEASKSSLPLCLEEFFASEIGELMNVFDGSLSPGLFQLNVAGRQGAFVPFGTEVAAVAQVKKLIEDTEEMACSLTAFKLG